MLLGCFSHVRSRYMHVICSLNCRKCFQKPGRVVSLAEQGETRGEGVGKRGANGLAGAGLDALAFFAGAMVCARDRWFCMLLRDLSYVLAFATLRPFWPKVFHCMVFDIEEEGQMSEGLDGVGFFGMAQFQRAGYILTVEKRRLLHVAFATLRPKHRWCPEALSNTMVLHALLDLSFLVAFAHLRLLESKASHCMVFHVEG